jgi:hypothetical protein
MDQCTYVKFLNDVKNHGIEIIKNDGLYRHVRFKAAKINTHWFDLIAWPNNLCITGDMGTFIFNCTDDMFDFFIMKKNDFNYKNIINPGYWVEKATTETVYGNGIREFSTELFLENVREYFDEQTEDMDKKEKEELWENEIIIQFYGEDEYECVTNIREFYHDKINFNDFWEMCNHKYTYHYIWCCYAIVWGIKKFREVTNG